VTRFSLFGFLLTSALALSARAESEQTIDSARIRLADVSDGYDGAELGELDLGPAPPPGNSRLVSRAEVEDQLHAAGDDAKKLRMPSALRVKSAAKRWSAEEVRTAFEAKLKSALPTGINYRSMRLSRVLVTSPRATIGDARFPRLQKREGEQTVTATVEVRQDDELLLRLPVTVIVNVTEAGMRPALEKGARVNLVIEHGPARVTALAIALSDAELGDTTSFRVSSTQRVLRARVTSPDTAQVVQ